MCMIAGADRHQGPHASRAHHWQLEDLRICGRDVRAPSGVRSLTLAALFGLPFASGETGEDRLNRGAQAGAAEGAFDDAAFQLKVKEGFPVGGRKIGPGW